MPDRLARFGGLGCDREIGLARAAAAATPPSALAPSCWPHPE